jgi:hypothetical protein
MINNAAAVDGDDDTPDDAETLIRGDVTGSQVNNFSNDEAISLLTGSVDGEEVSLSGAFNALFHEVLSQG